MSGFKSGCFSLLNVALVLLFLVPRTAVAADCSIVGDLGVAIFESGSNGLPHYDLFIDKGDGQIRVLDVQFKKSPKKQLSPGKVKVRGRISAHTLSIADPSNDLAPAAASAHHSSTCSLAGAIIVSGGGVTQGAAIASAPAVPAYNSRPGAKAQLYLNFVGDNVSSWGSYSPGVVPVYDIDGDPTTFSAVELANIQAIWQRVSEKYSPFEINVTTVNPGSLTEKVVTRVDIGGNGSWSGGTYGGIAYVGGFFNSSPNIAFVFTANLGNGAPSYTAEACSHEAGHTFGLNHQSSYSGTTKTAEYNLGDSLRAPIMGNSYYAARGLWWYGPNSLSSTSMQDDLLIVAGANNGFGYRADDHGNSAALADPLNVLPDGTVNTSGTIETLADLDVFYFNTAAGTITLKGNVNSVGPTLDLRLELRNSSDSVIAVSDTTTLGEVLTASVGQGTYYLVVAGHGGYGDLGQYTITGSVLPVGDTCVRSAPALTLSPASQSATPGAAVSYDVLLSNRDTTSCGSSTFNLSYADSFGGTGSFSSTTVSAAPGASAMATLSVTVPVSASGGTYGFTASAGDPAVASHSAQATGTVSVVVSAPDTQPPSVPTRLTATVQKHSAVKLTWVSASDNKAVAGYRVYRNGALLAQTSTTSYNDRTVTRGVSYTYQVSAFDAAGNASELSTGVTVKP